MPDELFIEDGYSKSHQIAAVSGLHPAVNVVYRPALARERIAYGTKAGTKDVAQVEAAECDLIVRYVLSLNGKDTATWRNQVARLHPVVRAALVDLIMSFTPANQAEAEGNSSGV